MYGLTPFGRSAFSVLNAFNDIDRDFFGGSMAVNSCRTDIRDEGDKYIMESELPGFDKEDIGIDINGSKIYITTQPCITCAKMCINAGIEEIIYANPYPDELSLGMLDEAHIPYRVFELPED